ncbi:MULTISPECIES: hypothetical protein [unclassified Pseudomonas]|uniref:hypothetical protein n=1 Tax=unclassified Pseudomonas TaxID=196821 RepID=UPI000FABBD7A|nr:MULTISPECIES: hypothetical protein [unclassified Pseudomonas]QYX46197.1 hypothetical protein K3F43_15980 [Pseudomonas sp. S11A 273]
MFRIDNEYRLVMHGSLFLLFIVVGNDAVGVVVLILAEWIALKSMRLFLMSNRVACRRFRERLYDLSFDYLVAKHKLLIIRNAAGKKNPGTWPGFL